eukprot:scaffold142791_cov36-Tisochrysis_lutea.AAC.1
MHRALASIAPGGRRAPFSGMSGCFIHCSLRPVRVFVHNILSTDLLTAAWNDLGAASVCSQYLGIEYMRKLATFVLP